MNNQKQNIFEDLFGKKPKKGYKFNNLSISLGYRAIILSWSCQGIGFGELAFIIDEKLKIDSEYMSNEFIFAALHESIKRLEEGQKIEYWDFSTNENGNARPSIENNESFIKSLLKYFLITLEQNPNNVEIY